jgi:hypothetical protein
MAYEQGKDIRREIGLKWGLTEEQIKEKEERLEQRVQQREIFEAKRDKIVSTLLQQCADEELTVSQTREILLAVSKEFDLELECAKVRLIHNHHQNCKDNHTLSGN